MNDAAGTLSEYCEPRANEVNEKDIAVAYRRLHEKTTTLVLVALPWLATVTEQIPEALIAIGAVNAIAQHPPSFAECARGGA